MLTFSWRLRSNAPRRGVAAVAQAAHAGEPTIDDELHLTPLAAKIEDPHAEQLTHTQRLRAIHTRAFEKFMLATAGPPVLLTSQTGG